MMIQAKSVVSEVTYHDGTTETFRSGKTAEVHVEYEIERGLVAQKTYVRPTNPEPGWWAVTTTMPTAPKPPRHICGMPAR